jgi:hypothetical protein
VKFNDMIMKRPPWVTDNPVKQRWMTVWVLHKLDEADMETYRRNHARPFVRPFKAKSRLGSARKIELGYDIELGYAERGNLEPLREKAIELFGTPLVARFINLPKLSGRGRHWRPRPEKKISHAHWAALDVRRIRALWVKHHGKKNRIGQQPTAEQIAAERWDLTVEQIHRASRKLPKR